MGLFDGEKVFDYPKPVKLIKRLIQYGAPNGGLVLDFFSGSATTAHAVMEYNAENTDVWNYIMVQLPENLETSLQNASNDSKKVLQNAISFCNYYNKPHRLTEIAKERIRRAGEKIKGESPLTTQDLDTGFRVLKLDDTNMEPVYYSAQEYSQDMLKQMESNIKPDRTDLDLLFGCLLDWGIPLSAPYTSEQVDGCTVHTYDPYSGDSPALIACFDANVPESVMKEIAKRKPLRAVFRDSSFADSPAKINVFEIFKLLSADTRVKVI